MTVQRDQNGTIINADELSVEEVVKEQVLCPACTEKVFKMWPFGWDAHSATVCTGVTGSTEEERKADFRERFAYLFR